MLCTLQKDINSVVMKDRLGRSPLKLLFNASLYRFFFWTTFSLSFHFPLFHKWKMSVHYIYPSLALRSFFLHSCSKNYITFHPTYNVWAISLLFFFCRSILWTCKLNVWWENTLSMYFYWNLFLWHLNGVASKLNVDRKDLESFHSRLSH